MSTVSRATKIQVVDTMPKPEELPDGTLYGTYSVTLPNKTKVVPFHFLREWDGAIDTETGFTRQFLRGFPRRKVRQDEYFSYRLTRPPMLVKPSHFDGAVYVDIKSAYPSIYKKLGWMTDYVRGRYWGVGAPMVYPYNNEWKAGRSYVVTGARHVQYGRYVNNGRVISKPYASPFSNPPLVAGVYDVLSCIARFAEYALKCRYFNIDGGIMPEESLQIFIPFVESLGLEARVKHRGTATILSGGYWKIGDHETKRYEAGAKSNIIGGDYIWMNKEDAEWVYKNFRKISERNK